MRRFDRRGRSRWVLLHSLVRAREFLNALGLTEIVANGAAQDKLNSEFVFLPTKLESPGLKYALVDSRLKLNPQDVGRVLKHSSGSIGVQLATDSLSGHQQIAIHLVGFEAGEVASALASYQAMYLSSAVTKSAGGRAPASEVRSGTGGSNVQSVASADDRSAAEQVWSSFRACGGGIVRGFNQIVLYPVYALNSAWVYVFGDALGIGKVDDAQFAKDPVQAVFASDKKRYRSAFSQGWEEYWSRYSGFGQGCNSSVGQSGASKCRDSRSGGGDAGKSCCGVSCWSGRSAASCDSRSSASTSRTSVHQRPRSARDRELSRWDQCSTRRLDEDIWQI